MIHIRLAPLDGPVFAAAGSPQEVRRIQAYLLTDRKKTAGSVSMWLPEKRCTLSLTRIPRQRCLRADHNSTWLWATFLHKAAHASSQGLYLPAGMIHHHSSCLDRAKHAGTTWGSSRILPPRNLPMLIAGGAVPTYRPVSVTIPQSNSRKGEGGAETTRPDPSALHTQPQPQPPPPSL